MQYVNHVYGRTGTLWDSRYKSSLVQAETYLLVCQRYIELNPVPAGIVADPGEYSWSSYRANALGETNPLLSPHPRYLSLGTDNACRRAAYLHLFRIALGDATVAELRMALNQSQPIGNDRFYAQIQAMTGQRRELRKRGRPRKQDETEASAESTQQTLQLN